MKISEALVVAVLILSTSASAQQSNLIHYILSPDKIVIEGISYLRAFEIFAQERYIEYGEPIAVEINQEEGTVDLSDFDGWTVRVPLAEAQSQPNKVDATK